MKCLEELSGALGERTRLDPRAIIGSLVAGALYISVLLLIVLLVRDAPHQPALGANIHNFMLPPNAYAYNDPKYFAMGAVDLYHHRWFTPENYWLIRLWPPGFMTLQAALLYLFGVDAPIILLLGCLSAALFTAVLLIARRYLTLYLSVWLASLIPLLVFSVPLVRLFLLEPIGLVFGEAFSIGFVLIAVALVAISGHSGSKCAAASAGICLALAAYFRSQYEILVNFLTLFAVAWLFWAVTARLVWRERLGPRGHLATGVSLALIVVLSAQLAMLPWRISSRLDPNIQSFAWVHTQRLIYKNNGMTDEELFKVQGGWIVRGGGNLGCKIDAKYCGQSSARSFYASFARNAVEWYRQKVPLWKKYWFASNRTFGDAAVGGVPSATETAANIIFLICLFVTWPLLWMSRQSPEVRMLVWFSLSLQTAFFLLLTFVHMETRYFYLLKIESLFMVLLLIGPVMNAYRGNRDLKLSLER